MHTFILLTTNGDSEIMVHQYKHMNDFIDKSVEGIINAQHIDQVIKKLQIIKEEMTTAEHTSKPWIEGTKTI